MSKRELTVVMAEIFENLLNNTHDIGTMQRAIRLMDEMNTIDIDAIPYWVLEHIYGAEAREMFPTAYEVSTYEYDEEVR